MSKQRIAVLERLARQYLKSNPKWAAQWGEELSRLRAAERKATNARMERVMGEVREHIQKREAQRRLGGEPPVSYSRYRRTR